MIRIIKKYFYLLLGGMFFIIGLAGVVLPFLPTVVFMILALGCFAKSSPRFYKALLNNRFCGEDLRLWEKDKTMSRDAKKRATIMIIIMFSISIFLLMGHWKLQIMLVVMAIILLFFLWKVAEKR